jgi:hypothetical protein
LRNSRHEAIANRTQNNHITAAIDRQGLGVQSPPARGHGDAHALSTGGPMFDLRDLFQWERFITPSIIKIFYWLAVGMSMLLGLSGVLAGMAMMFLNPFGGLFMVFSSLIGILMGVILARIMAEYVLIMFRINEHLGAIRNRGQM